MSKKAKINFLLIVFIFTFLDIFSKYWVFESFSVVIFNDQNAVPANAGMIRLAPGVFVPADYQRTEIIPSFFYIETVVNRGAVWGVMQGETLFLTIISILAIIFICYLVVKKNTPDSHSVPLALITAGAIGNLWDRLNFSGVRDFLDFYIGSFHWPTFNLADAFIVVGVGIYFIMEFTQNSQQKQQPKNQKG